MPFFFKTSTQRLAEDFKHYFCELAETTRTKQDAIATSLGVSQPCIAHWMDAAGDRHFPAALIPELPAEIRVEMIRYLARQMDVRVNVNLNGRIDDEIVDLAEKTGEFIQMFRADRTQKAALIVKAHEMRSIIDQAIAEVDAL